MISGITNVRVQLVGTGARSVQSGINCGMVMLEISGWLLLMVNILFPQDTLGLKATMPSLISLQLSGIALACLNTLFTAWLVAHGRLLTMDRLQQWFDGVVDESCVLFGGAIESHNHLFFECLFSANPIYIYSWVLKVWL